MFKHYCQIQQRVTGTTSYSIKAALQQMDLKAY